jgi:hypothetical protein
MRNGYRPPAPESVLEHVADSESSFFARTTVAPLYEALKRHAKKSLPASDNPLASLICCCRKLGRERTVRNSQRSNYDDLNEAFWSPACLAWGYHSLDDEMGIAASIPHIRKTFREKASWSAVLLSVWRWAAFQAVLFHFLFLVAWEIVKAGGVNILGIAQIDIVTTLLRATGAFETLGYTHLLLCVTSAAHAIPFGSPRFLAEFFPLLTFRNVLKGAYALAWTGVLVVAANGKALLGADLLGGPAWLGIVGARALCILVAEGIFSPCGCRRTNP